MSPILVLALFAACRSALPNPEPVAQPAAWVVERQPAPRALGPNPEAAQVQPQGSAPAPAAVQNNAPRPGATPAPVAGALPIAFVAGDAIDASELLKQMLHEDSFGLFDRVDRLVKGRLVQFETARLGIVPDEAVVEKLYKQAVVDFESRIQKKRPGVTLDKYVDSGLQLDVVIYREMLRADVQRAWLAERCVRSFMLQSEHANVRVLVVKSEDELKAAQAELAGGTSFEEVAKKRSADPSAKDGGRSAPVLKSGSIMGLLAFNTPIGAISEPKYDKGVWLLVKVESRPDPLKGDWKAIREAVEQNLTERAIDDIEYKQWEEAMHARYRIDPSALLRLCGEPVR